MSTAVRNLNATIKLFLEVAVKDSIDNESFIATTVDESEFAYAKNAAMRPRIQLLLDSLKESNLQQSNAEEKPVITKKIHKRKKRSIIP